ncbi:TonB family protein [Comamonas serinivorans]|nr:TonB family protein [Comamonas serinivorans]
MPSYPAQAQRLEVEGRVMVRATVALDGSVTQAEVVASAANAAARAAVGELPLHGAEARAAQALDAEALRMVRACRFGAVTGNYTPAQVQIPVRFRME